MAEFKDRLNQALSMRDMKPAELAKLTGIGEGAISQYRKGAYKASQRNLEKISDALSVSIPWLMGVLNEPDGSAFTPPAPNLLPAPAFVRKPRLGRVACGQPILAAEHIDGYDLVPEEIKCDFTLVCKGDSMINARIFDGDIVCVRQQPEVENGEIAVVLVDEDEATLKRFYRYDDHIELRAENPSFRDKAFWDADMSRVRVIGRATHFIGEVR